MNKDFNDIIESFLKCKHYIGSYSNSFNNEFISNFGKLLDWYYNHLDNEVFVKRLQDGLQTMKDTGYIYDYKIDNDFSYYCDIIIKNALSIDSIMSFHLEHHSENKNTSKWGSGLNGL